LILRANVAERDGFRLLSNRSLPQKTEDRETLCRQENVFAQGPAGERNALDTGASTFR